MYWPVGIPNYFGISKGKHQDLVRNSASGDDDVQPDQVRDNAQSQTAPSEAAKTPSSPVHEQEILDLKTSRGGQIFASISRSSLQVWQAKPTALLAAAVRSRQSLESYGSNVALLVRPDALIIVVQTSQGFLITYSIASDFDAQVYQLQLRTSAAGRRQSAEGIRKSGRLGPDYGPGDGFGIRDISLRFRMVIRVDAGICKAIPLDDELVVATAKPAAIQCIRWSPDKSGSSHVTELLKRMPWLGDATTIVDMAFDRPMGLHVWLSDNGKAFTVQRNQPRKQSDGSTDCAFQGFCFHEPGGGDEARARCLSINARFSLIALGCADCKIRVYTVKDYLGNIPLSHVLELPVSSSTSGRITFLANSPDGHCLFAGFEKGWAMWSVYGKLGAHSFMADRSSPRSDQTWLRGCSRGFWTGLGSELLLLDSSTSRLCAITMARAAAVSCLAMPNIQKALLQTSTAVMVHRTQDSIQAGSSDAKVSTWQTLQIPGSYLSSQWPIKCSAVSACGKYLAAAGRRGLVHHSKASGRWKTFEDPYAENEFAVRGGLCWYQHILVAAVECELGAQIRLYSREKNLNSSSMIHTEQLNSPVVHVTMADLSSLLIYTAENVLYHYVFEAIPNSVKITQVGQIGFHGIIRAPARVRSISWIVPDDQRERGNPSQDVATAAVIFLIDGKLVLLQPSPEEHRELKYDMRVIAHNVEYYLLAREGHVVTPTPAAALLQPGMSPAWTTGDSLVDSLWFFDGQSMRVWPDVHDLISSTASELAQSTPPAVSIATDFYPIAPLLSRGIIAGLEPEIIQRRDVEFDFSRATPRTQLFLPPLLQHYLRRYDTPAALHLSDSYRHLPYFSHALEVLLHLVLDEEVDAEHETGDVVQHDSPLASLLPFLSSFPTYLDIILGCARKTEIRSWATLFRHLPPVTQLFEQAVAEEKLKTAGGFLLVLHTFDEDSFNADMMGRLLMRAGKDGDWDLCKELARFLVGVDRSGQLLGEAMRRAGMGDGVRGRGSPNGTGD